MAPQFATRTRARTPVSQFKVERRPGLAITNNVGAVLVVQTRSHFAPQLNSHTPKT